MKRREFIGIAAVGAAGVVLPMAARGEAALAGALARPRLIEILCDERLVRVLGQCYRSSVPGEDHPDTLADVILEAVDAGSQGHGASHASPSKLEMRIDEQVQREFAAGRTVTLHGWILSVTEARQCALLSLLPA